MNPTLIAAIITITLALIFYSVGVWTEKIQKVLKVRHLVLFVLGLICDSTGTALMSTLADHSAGSKMGVHGVTGAIAIILMLVHAIWALIVLLKKDEKRQQNFHKFSIFVWLIWLVPYFIGMFMGMGTGNDVTIIGGADGPTTVFVAGKLGDNDMEYEQINMEMAKAIFEEPGDYIILDVRRTDEFSEGHIPGAINVANEIINDTEPEELPDKNQTIYVYCRSGNRSKQAAEKLAALGYTNIIEFGGIIDWTGEIEK